jgi:hypothetical protein
MWLLRTFLFGCIATYECATLVYGQAPAPSPSSNPICYICGGDPNATITNPTVLITIPPEFGSPMDQLTCDQIEQAGLSGFIPVDACTIFENDVASQALCGCSNLSTTGAPVVAPVSTPAPVVPTSPTAPTAPSIRDIIGSNPNFSRLGQAFDR